MHSQARSLQLDFNRDIFSETLDNYIDVGCWTPTTLAGGPASSGRPSTVQSPKGSIFTTQPRSPGEQGPPRRKGQPGGPDLPFWNEFMFVSVIASAQALMLSGVTQALAPATIIGASFGLSGPAQLAWFSAAYALTSGTFVLPAGRLGDLFGHKIIFIVGFFWFAAWSFIAGFGLQVQEAGGNGLIFFDFCRAMQGIGPALLVPNGQAMLGRAYSPGLRKNIVMSLFGAAAPFGAVIGSVLASLLAQLASWPWAFWLLAIVCVGLGILSIFVIPPSSVAKKSDTAESLWTRMDGPGIVFGVSGLILINFAWNQAPVVSWSTPYVYFLLIIGLMITGIFIYVELRARYPLVPIQAMNTQTNFILGCTAAGWGSFGIWVFYYYQFNETIRGWSPLLTSGSQAQGPIFGLIASILVAVLMGKIKPHWIMLASMCAFTIGSLFMAVTPIGQTYWGLTFFSMVIMPFGMDMSNPAAIILLSNSVSKEHQGIAASLVVTVVNYSISLGLGFAATIDSQVGGQGQHVLAGMRAAQYFGVALGGLGVVIALAFLMTTFTRIPGPRASNAAPKASANVAEPVGPS